LAHGVEDGLGDPINDALSGDLHQLLRRDPGEDPGLEGTEPASNLVDEGGGLDVLVL
jgi:hypothetical protein